MKTKVSSRKQPIRVYTNCLYQRACLLLPKSKLPSINEIIYVYT